MEINRDIQLELKRIEKRAEGDKERRVKQLKIPTSMRELI